MSNAWMFKEARARALRRQAAGHVRVRRADELERGALFEGGYGFVACAGGMVVGYLGFEIREDHLFCYNFFSLGPPHTAAMLYAAASTFARKEGLGSIRFEIAHPHYDLVRLIESGRARILSTLCEVRI